MRAAIYARVSTVDQEPENQLQELRRQASSSIVLPGTPGAAGLPGGLPPGGLGGKIKMP